MMNPYTPEKIGNYDFADYMAWDWLGMGKSYTELVELQKQVFE